MKYRIVIYVYVCKCLHSNSAILWISLCWVDSSKTSDSMSWAQTTEVTFRRQMETLDWIFVPWYVFMCLHIESYFQLVLCTFFSGCVASFLPLSQSRTFPRPKTLRNNLVRGSRPSAAVWSHCLSCGTLLQIYVCAHTEVSVRCEQTTERPSTAFLLMNSSYQFLTVPYSGLRIRKQATQMTPPRTPNPLRTLGSPRPVGDL